MGGDEPPGSLARDARAANRGQAALPRATQRDLEEAMNQARAEKLLDPPSRNQPVGGIIPSSQLSSAIELGTDSEHDPASDSRGSLNQVRDRCHCSTFESNTTKNCSTLDGQARPRSGWLGFPYNSTHTYTQTHTHTHTSIASDPH